MRKRLAVVEQRTGELCGGRRTMLCDNAACDLNIAHRQKGDHAASVADRAKACSLVIAQELGPLTLEEVGELMGYSKEMARQVEAHGLSRLARKGVRWGE